MLNIFDNDAFSVVSLTTSINKLPYTPSRIGQMGLFSSKGVPTLSAVIEEQDGMLMLITSAARGTHPNVYGGNGRKARILRIPHFPLEGEVKADDVQGVRAFGSEDQLESVVTTVNDKLGGMRQSFEVTHEWLRLGALKGIVIDGDGSTTLYNLFTEFGLVQTEVDFDFTDATLNVKQKALDTIRLIEDALGGTTYNHVHAVCGNDFFDALVSHAVVKEAFDRYQESAFFRQQQAAIGNQPGGFEYGGIFWENYRGHIGAQAFVDADTAHFFPVGIPELFQSIWGPANFIESVNTIGQPIYAKQAPQKFETGVDLHTQSNALMICNRPKCLVKGNSTAGST